MRNQLQSVGNIQGWKVGKVRLNLNLRKSQFYKIFIIGFVSYLKLQGETNTLETWNTLDLMIM